MICKKLCVWFLQEMETDPEENYEEIAAANRSVRGKKDSEIAGSYVIQSLF